MCAWFLPATSFDKRNYEVSCSRCSEHDTSDSAGYESDVGLLPLRRSLKPGGLIRDDLPFVPVLGHHECGQTLGRLVRALVKDSDNRHGDIRLEETDLLQLHLCRVFLEPGLEELRP